MDEVEDSDTMTHFRELEADDDNDDKTCFLNISFFNIMYFFFIFIM